MCCMSENLLLSRQLQGKDDKSWQDSLIRIITRIQTVLGFTVTFSRWHFEYEAQSNVGHVCVVRNFQTRTLGARDILSLVGDSRSLLPPPISVNDQQIICELQSLHRQKYLAELALACFIYLLWINPSNIFNFFFLEKKFSNVFCLLQKWDQQLLVTTAIAQRPTLG